MKKFDVLFVGALVLLALVALVFSGKYMDTKKQLEMERTNCTAKLDWYNQRLAVRYDELMEARNETQEMINEYNVLREDYLDLQRDYWKMEDFWNASVIECEGRMVYCPPVILENDSEPVRINTGTFFGMAFNVDDRTLYNLSCEIPTDCPLS